jgi:hypothetical protein
MEAKSGLSAQPTMTQKRPPAIPSLLARANEVIE